MKKKRYLATISLLLVVGINFTACGNSTQPKKSDTAPHMTPDEYAPVQHIGKYSKNTQQYDFDPDKIEWEYDNHEGLKIHIDDANIYLDFTYENQTQNVQFFIDTDNNAKTGNLDEGGAEYMVENGYLYKSLDPKEWKWQEIAKLKSAIKPQVRDTVSIKRKDLKNLNVVFGVNAQALDDKWHPKVKSPIDGSKSLYSDKNAIDWDSVKPYTTNEDKIVKVFDTDKMLYLHIEQNERKKHIQVYIDSDNNPSTGYVSNSWNNFGRDYLIEDSNLYIYTGSNGWGWEKISSVERRRHKSEKDILDIAIPKSSFSFLSQKIRIGVETNNDLWNDTAFIPKGDIPLYNLKSPIQKSHIRINEIMAANANTLVDPDYYNFSDWIELYNPNDTSVDISGYSLSDKLNKPKWTFPNGTIIKAFDYLLVWADEKDKSKKALHTNFKLKMGGEAVALFDKDKNLIDGFEYLKQRPDISVSAIDDKLYYMNPTAGYKNEKGYESAILAQKPNFSLKEGFYDQPVTLTISSPQNGTIRYTTNGSTPTLSSPIYTDAITIDKSTSVRAISVINGKFKSEVVTKSYIIGERIDIPVVSIAIDEKYLNDDTIGIYTVGTNGKKIKDCGEENIPPKANYAQKWERPAHLTLFESNDTVVLSQDIGLKVAGECSRIYPQKSFQLKADDKYGKDKFSYAIFKDKPIKKYERLKLRNGGQDFIKTHIRDALEQYIVKDELNVQYEAYRPALLFINGDFWGVYSLREKMGKEYFEENFEKKKVNLLIDDRIVKEGSSSDYDELVDFLQNNSLQSDENYNFVASKIDIDNYIDYMITNIYSANADWPGTNLVYWKPKKGGGKWRWVLHDMDFGFACSSDWGVEYDALKAATATNGDIWPNPQWSTLLFRKLLENRNFKSKFTERFISKLDTTFAPQRITHIIDTMSSKIKPYMQRHIQRWQTDGQYSYAVNSEEDWLKEVQKLKDFANKRADIVKNHIQQQLR